MVLKISIFSIKDIYLKLIIFKLCRIKLRATPRDQADEAPTEASPKKTPRGLSRPRETAETRGPEKKAPENAEKFVKTRKSS
jgi:hypothetical protein